MNKENYLKKLRNLLQQLPEDEINDSIYDIEEYFRLAYEDGKSDSEIVRVLGSPEKLAQSIKLDYQIENPNSRSYRNLGLFFRIIGLGFANIILLPLFLSIGCVIVLLHICVWLLFLSSAIAFLACISRLMVPGMEIHFISLPSQDPYIIALFASVIFLIAFVSNKGVTHISSRSLRFLNNYYKKNNSILKYQK